MARCCNTASRTCRAPADEGQAVHDIARRNRHQCILRIAANPEFIGPGPAPMFSCRSVARSNQRQGFPAVQVIGSTWRAAFPGQDLHRGRRSLRLKYSGDHARCAELGAERSAGADERSQLQRLLHAAGGPQGRSSATSRNPQSFVSPSRALAPSQTAPAPMQTTAGSVDQPQQQPHVQRTRLHDLDHRRWLFCYLLKDPRGGGAYFDKEAQAARVHPPSLGHRGPCSLTDWRIQQYNICEI